MTCACHLKNKTITSKQHGLSLWRFRVWHDKTNGNIIYTPPTYYSRWYSNNCNGKTCIVLYSFYSQLKILLHSKTMLNILTILLTNITHVQIYGCEIIKYVCGATCNIIIMISTSKIFFGRLYMYQHCLIMSLDYDFLVFADESQ